MLETRYVKKWNQEEAAVWWPRENMNKRRTRRKLEENRYKMFRNKRLRKVVKN